jgi:DNA-binding NarL/FixJ family response regulator
MRMTDPTMTQPSFEAREPALPRPLLVVEDDPAMQVRLRGILATLGYADDALSFAETLGEAEVLFSAQRFAMVLVDCGLPDGNGIDLIHKLYAKDPALPILVISAWRSPHTILSALQAGATGYLLKERDEIEITLSIRSALRGGAPIDPFIAKHILALAGSATSLLRGSGDATQHAIPAAPLSRREIEVLGLVGKGLTNREISGLLSLSRLTVECHIKNIYKKLAVNSRTQAIFEARTHGLLP